MAQAHPTVRVIASPRNLGFAAGVNRLVETVPEADAVALLNNDTRPAADWLGELVETLGAAPEDVVAVSGRIVDWGGERLDFGRGVMTFDGHAFQLDYRRLLAAARIPSAGEELPFACGGNLLARRERFRWLGGFDPAYFAYYEDVDLGWRIWASGGRVTAAPGAVVHHRSSGTSDRLGQFRRGLLFERNAFATAYKNYDARLWPKMMPAVLLTLLSRTHTLLVAQNPGGEELARDPYLAEAGGPSEIRADPGLWRKLVSYGPREAARRAVRKLGRRLAGVGAGVSLTDPQTVAQLQAVAGVLEGLDDAAGRRQQTQARRVRSDCEIFERFPPYLVPTYPGDEELFASSGFRAWLPPELPLIEARLDEIMVWP